MCLGRTVTESNLKSQIKNSYCLIDAFLCSHSDVGSVGVHFDTRIRTRAEIYDRGEHVHLRRHPERQK